MTELEGQQTSSPETSFEAKGNALKDATLNLAGFIDPSGGVEGDQLRWRSGGIEPTGEEREAAKGFIQNLLDYREEGRWDSVEDALAEKGGISLGENDRESLIRLKDFLERQGITGEEMKRGEQEERQETEQVGSSSGELREGREEPRRKTPRRGPPEMIDPEMREARERGEARGGKYYEYQRREQIAIEYGLDIKKLMADETEPGEVLEAFTDSLERRRQYITMILGELMVGGHFIEKHKAFSLIGSKRTDSKEAAMFKAAEYIQKCQGVTGAVETVEGFRRAVGSPSPEVFDGLRKLILRLEVKTESGERYSGELSPFDMMDLMDSPKWSQRLMINRRDDEGFKERGFYDWRSDLVNELLCQQLKDREGNPLPEKVKITETNLYDFPLMVKMDAGPEQIDDVRDPLIGTLWYLHEIAWHLFSSCGRPRAWDKALEGRWEFDYFRKPFLPANYEGTLYNTGVWHARRFFRIIQWYDFFSEQKDMLPILQPKWPEDRKERFRQQDIITRKVMRRGALPHLEEEESKIALGLGEYAGRDWFEKATLWLNDRRNITRKGEMKSWEGMQNVSWTEEEVEAIQNLDFRQALELMKRLDPKVVVDGEIEKVRKIMQEKHPALRTTGDTRGVEGYYRVVTQLSYRNLDYGRVPRKAFLSQMRYTMAADNSYGIIKAFIKAAGSRSSWGTYPDQEARAGITFWSVHMQGLRRKLVEAASQFTNAITYVTDAQKTEAGKEVLWLLAQCFTFYRRDWLTQVRKDDEGFWHEVEIRENNKEDFPKERRKQLERLGYQFIRIGGEHKDKKGSREERVFGPSGAPLKKLVKCSGDNRTGCYCPAYHQRTYRALGHKFIGSVANELASVDLIGDAEAIDSTMAGIKARVPDELPVRLPKDKGVRLQTQTPRKFENKEFFEDLSDY